MKLSRWLVIICCFLTSSVFAADKWYQVEILIFKQASNSKIKEKLPEGAILPNSASGIPVNSSGDSSLTRGSSVAFRSLGESFFSLRQQYEKLIAASKYTPIVHLSWRQPIKFRKSGYKLWIQGGRLLSSNSSNSNDPDLNSSANQSNYEIFGNITISRARFLHVYTNIIYRNQASSESDKSEFVHFRMKDHRRLNSREINYLDHPMFGMLVYIKPI